MKIHIEIGKNLKEIITKAQPESIKAIMGQFTEMIAHQKTYICPICGTANFIGEYCVRCKEK